jgi:hypothetical protein
MKKYANFLTGSFHEQKREAALTGREGVVLK